jgi:hypothetical protein
MTAAVTRGQLVDVRNVNQHKCVRLIIDVPAELAPSVIKAFGWPTQVNPVPVAIARLIESPQQQEEQAASSKTPVPTAQPRQGSPTTPHPAGATYAQRLGIACGKPSFWRFLEEQKLQAKPYAKIACADEAADVVRFLCEVKSRTETLVGTPAGNRADSLLSEYTAWELT